MAFIWKYPSDCKGIIMLTQKEFSLLPLFEKYKKDYLFGCHVGCYYKFPERLKNFDFILASKNQFEGKIDFEDKLIELNSRNFLPRRFMAPRNIDRVKALEAILEINKYSAPQVSVAAAYTGWDILWVNKPHSVKNVEIFLKELRKLFTKYGPHTTLIIAAISPNEKKSPKDFFDVEDFINNNFIESERDYISIARPSTDGNEGMDNKFMPYFYFLSKVFCFYSEYEGESRVTHEALCGNCKVVYYKDLKGGAADYLNPRNSLAFEEYDGSFEVIHRAVRTYREVGDIKDIWSKCIVSETLPVFKEELTKIYEKHNQKFDGELLDIPELHFELPAHNHKVPWKNPQNETGDLTSEYFNVFLKENEL